MKKIFSMAMVVVVLTAILAACGGAAPASCTTSAPAQATTAVEPTVVPAAPQATTASEPAASPPQSQSVSNKAAPNWLKWHDPSAEASELFNKMNGTGPYKPSSWKPGEGFELSLTKIIGSKSRHGKADLRASPASRASSLKKSMNGAHGLPLSRQAMPTMSRSILNFRPRLTKLLPKIAMQRPASANRLPGLPPSIAIADLPKRSSTDVLLNANINTEGGNNYIGSGAGR